MASALLVSESEYLHTVYEPDCEFVDGEVIERNAGEYPRQPDFRTSSDVTGTAPGPFIHTGIPRPGYRGASPPLVFPALVHDGPNPKWYGRGNGY